MDDKYQCDHIFLGKGTVEENRKGSGFAGGEESTGSNSSRMKRIKHPLLLRLNESSGLSLSSPLSLVSTGYASLTMALFNLFRPTPFFLYVLASRYRKISSAVHFNKVTLFTVLFIWKGLVLFVLFVLGVVLVSSKKITKRWILLLHPWGLLLLYLDLFVWISLTLWLHLEISKVPELSSRIFDQLHHPLVFLVIIYVECFAIGVLYYVYATYFIVAELTIIEKFF